MNKLAQILGIQFSNEIEISSVVNTTDKVKKILFFLLYKEHKIMEVNI